MEDLTGLVSNKRRRLLLKYLIENDDSADLEDVIKYICRVEGDPECRNRKSVYISLKQTHIPKLEKANIIVYNRRENKLILEESIKKDVKMYIEFVEGVDISWSKYYFGLSFAALVLSFITMNSIGLLISSLFLISSSINIAKERRIL